MERSAHASLFHLQLPFPAFNLQAVVGEKGAFEQLIVVVVFFLEQEDKINQMTVINCHLSSCCAALEGVVSRGRVTADISVIFITVSVVSHSRRLRLWSCGLIVSTYLCVCACVCSGFVTEQSSDKGLPSLINYSTRTRQTEQWITLWARCSALHIAS